MENLILLAIAAVIFLFLWLFWVRQKLIHHYLAAENFKELVLKDAAHRRDTIPYLLEGFRGSEEYEEQWKQILKWRSEMIGNTNLKDEWAFAGNLLKTLEPMHLPKVQFLDAKKDIEDLTDIINLKRSEFEGARNEFEKLQKRFPYTLASAMFGLRKLKV